MRAFLIDCCFIYGTTDNLGNSLSILIGNELIVFLPKFAAIRVTGMILLLQSIRTSSFCCVLAVCDCSDHVNMLFVFYFVYTTPKTRIQVLNKNI